VKENIESQLGSCLHTTYRKACHVNYEQTSWNVPEDKQEKKGSNVNLYNIILF
jgi:hypothetical protein